jgi:cytochrome oxidase assembly protein ShyY1
MDINTRSWIQGLKWIIFLLGFSILIRLGFWQLSRMEEKKETQRVWRLGQNAKPQALETILSDSALPKAHQRVILPSLFWLSYVLLLDNQSNAHQAGYRIFYLASTQANTLSKPLILVKGPWIPYGSIEHNPFLNPENSLGVINAGLGYIQFPSRGFQLGKQSHSVPLRWPLIVQWIDLNQLSDLIGHPIAPFWIQLDRPITLSLSPQKHLGYAVQWFLFAGLWLAHGIFLLQRKHKGSK